MFPPLCKCSEAPETLQYVEVHACTEVLVRCITITDSSSSGKCLRVEAAEKKPDGCFPDVSASDIWDTTTTGRKYLDRKQELDEALKWNISAAQWSLMEEWGIETKVPSIVNEAGANMVASRLFEERQSVGAALATLRIDVWSLSSEDHDTVSACLKLLAPFYQATVELSEEKRVSGQAFDQLLFDERYRQTSSETADSPPPSTAAHYRKCELLNTKAWLPPDIIQGAVD
ncbi:hypothetical protein FQN60_013911 [Etheostoma spectabile]|uniref:Uncharacterized protein n=1 Tax=Etheostoma spectabile TaxID=54343 RepID=A0A5J5CJN4_9PERO|nr:hypothetical protein FQN60_013911 [Etheostoma spectabile]